MELNLGRIGSYLSDRIVLVEAEQGQQGFVFRKADTWWDWFLRIVSWIYSPASYTEENLKTIQCFQRFLTEQLGKERVDRVCTRYGIDLGAMEKRASPLLSRDIAKIFTGIRDVKTEDLEEAIALSKRARSEWPLVLSDDLRCILRRVGCSQELSAENFEKAYEELKSPSKSFSLPKLKEINGGQPSELFATLFFDRFLADRERLSLQEENPQDEFEVFAHNFSMRIMQRDLEVGMLVPAPNGPTGKPQFYRVAARLITGDGNVSYCLQPATKDTELETIQFYRGTVLCPAEIDAFSTIITDFEKNIGNTAWESGAIYRPLIKAYLSPTIVSGHSLGSNLAQHDIVENPNIRKAYLFHGPGLSEEKVQQFNARMKQRNSQAIQLIIRDGDRDDLSAMGTIHIGFQAPRDKVFVDHRKYFTMEKIRRHLVHTTLWGKVQRIYGFSANTDPQKVDAQLNHKENGSFEPIRGTVGPYLAKILRILRDLFRWIFGARAVALQGLQIGIYEGGGFWRSAHWKVRQIRPQQVTQALAEFYAG